MFRRPAFQSVFARFAIFAVLLASLAPAISQTLAGPADVWVEICSAEGGWLMPDGTPTDKMPAPHASGLDHCPFCFHSSHLALPSPDARMADPGRADFITPLAFLHAPRPLHAWASAQPRAPPA